MNADFLFRSIPDAVFITDSYGYILDHNRREPFDLVKKGAKLRSVIPDCFEGETGVFRFAGRAFRRQTSPILRENTVAGYTVMLADVTAEARITGERREKSRELTQLVESLQKSNAELESYAVRVKELTDYAEQLRIAQVIHDDAGHAITELYTISQMCLKLMDTDPERYRELIREGLEICRKAKNAGEAHEYGSLRELLSDFARMSRIPVEVRIDGEEPPFLKDKYPLIERILKEAYHNTLDHSLADRIEIDAQLSEDGAALAISDSGSFHGEFEKGFGLSTMEDNVALSGGSVTFTAQEGRGFGIKVKWRKTV